MRACAPSAQGEAVFRGERIHAKDFADVGRAKGKRVLIVGAGRTALECVAEVVVSEAATSATLLCRQASAAINPNTLKCATRPCTYLWYYDYCTFLYLLLLDY